MIVVVYAPTNQDSNEEKDKFYEDLNYVVSRGNGNVMVIGDFNASVSDRLHGVVGPYGLRSKASDNGERLMSFACANSLCIANTLCPGQTMPEGINNSHQSVQGGGGADIDSDHQLVMTSIRVKLQKKYKEKRGKLFDVKLLHKESTKADFINSVTKSFENRKMEGNVQER